MDDLLRSTGLHIFHRTLLAVDVESVLRTNLRLCGHRLEIVDEDIDLSDYRNVIVIAIGKAAVPMARAAENILGSNLKDGLVVTSSYSGESTLRLPVVIGGHPLPDEGSVIAAEKAIELLHKFDSDGTLALFLISGGGSALFEKPIDEKITLDDLQTINRILVGCGAVIGEMNVVRRFLSSVKGGRLAEIAPRARQVSLFISDVNSDDLSTISSGPTLAGTVTRPVTRKDFDRIVARYDLLDKFPAHISALIESGLLPDLPEVRKEGDRLRSQHLLLDNRMALIEAGRIASREFECVVEIADDLVEGEVSEMARVHIERVMTLRSKYPGKIVCLLSGGEVICPVRGDGRGGRNQEFVLRAGLMLEKIGEDDIEVLSAGTDGIDGNSPAAGAIASGASIRNARELGIIPEDHLERSDSFGFFEASGDAIITGPTGNNVRDLRIFVAKFC